MTSAVSPLQRAFLASVPSETGDVRPREAPKPSSDILFVAMNEGGKDEARALSARGQHVTVVSSQPKALSSREAIADFAAGLALSPRQTSLLVEALVSCPRDARDELAALAQAWAQGALPSRLVLSGHSVGTGVFGDDNGFLSWESLEKLTHVFPDSAQAIEDVHLSACYSASERTVERFRQMFPHLKTFFAYEGSAPGSASGSITHLLRWEKATRGATTDLSRTVASGTRKAEEVATWSEGRGYEGKDSVALDTLLSRHQSQGPTFQAYFQGAAEVTDAQSGPLREHYNLLQRLLQHPLLPVAERSALEQERDVTLRLLYYSRVAPRFQQTHQADLAEAFSSLNLPVPDFSRLSRRQALAVISGFEERLAQLDRVPPRLESARQILTSGLRALSPPFIPLRWI